MVVKPKNSRNNKLKMTNKKQTKKNTYQIFEKTGFFSIVFFFFV